MSKHAKALPPRLGLVKAAAWIKTRNLAEVEAAHHRGGYGAQLSELKSAWAQGQIEVFGSVDGAPSRKLLPHEADDYVIEDAWRPRAGMHAGSLGIYTATVRSLSSHPENALKDHSRKSSVLLFMASAPAGVTSYHRVISGARVDCDVVMQRWPARPAASKKRKFPRDRDNPQFKDLLGVLVEHMKDEERCPPRVSADEVLFWFANVMNRDTDLLSGRAVKRVIKLAVEQAKPHKDFGWYQDSGPLTEQMQKRKKHWLALK